VLSQVVDKHYSGKRTPMLAFAPVFVKDALRSMNTFWKWMIGILLVFLLCAFTGLSFMAGSPKDAYGMLRYALPHMHRGKLKVGDDAPDARLVALDGSDHFHIRERAGSKPLVLVFGSFT
jgi:hypothetical protein